MLVVLSLVALVLAIAVKFAKGPRQSPPRRVVRRQRLDLAPLRREIQTLNREFISVKSAYAEIRATCRFASRVAAENFLRRRGYLEQDYCVWYLPDPTHRGTMAEISYSGDGEFGVDYWRLDGKDA